MVNMGGDFFSAIELNEMGIKRIGKNVKISKKASIYGLENISIGDNVRIDDFVVIIATGQMTIGSFVSIHNFCFFGAKKNIELQDFVTIAPGVKIFTSSDDYEGEKLTGVMVPSEMTGGKTGDVLLQNHVIIGSGSIILPRLTISEGCSIGALSLVKKSLNPWGVYAGVPVKFIKKRKNKLLDLASSLIV